MARIVAPVPPGVRLRSATPGGGRGDREELREASRRRFWDKAILIAVLLILSFL